MIISNRLFLSVLPGNFFSNLFSNSSKPHGQFHQNLIQLTCTSLGEGQRMIRTILRGDIEITEYCGVRLTFYFTLADYSVKCASLIACRPSDCPNVCKIFHIFIFSSRTTSWVRYQPKLAQSILR